MQLLDLLAGESQLVVVDAVQLGAPPGTVHRLDWDALPPAQRMPVTSHGLGVRETIEIGRRLYPERMPRQVTLIGIDRGCFGFSSAMRSLLRARVGSRGPRPLHLHRLMLLLESRPPWSRFHSEVLGGGSHRLSLRRRPGRRSRSTRRPRGRRRCCCSLHRRSITNRAARTLANTRLYMLNFGRANSSLYMSL